MKNFFLLLLFIVQFFVVSLLYADFEQARELLMPLEQIKQKLFLIVGDAGVDVNTWKKRFDRFESHIRILRDKAPDQLNRVKNGFKETADNDLLTFLGIKPASMSFKGGTQALIANHYLQGLRYKKYDSGYSDHSMAGLPTIPFSVYFKSYKSVFVHNNEVDAIDFYKNFDTLSDNEQFEIIKKKEEEFLENKLHGNSEISLILGYQTGAWVGGPMVNCDNVLAVVQAFHLLWNYQGALLDLANKNSGKAERDLLLGPGKMNTLSLNFVSSWGGSQKNGYDMRINDSFSVMRWLTFCLFPKNYRLVFHNVGVLLFNDNQCDQSSHNPLVLVKIVPRPSAYAKMLGFLYEYFFRSAFGDQHYLTLLYRDIVAIPISLAPALQKINDDNLITNTIVPPLIETFQKFLTKTFGDTWNWDAASKTLTFDDNKKDLTLKNFLMVAEQENLLNIKLGRLQNALKKLKERLALFNQKLMQLQGQLH